MAMNNTSAAVFADLVRASIGDATGVVERDLAALVVALRETPGDPSSDQANLSKVAVALDGDTAAQQQLKQILVSVSNTSDIEFGPVVQGTPAVAERLELLYRIDSGSAMARKATKDFVAESDRGGADPFTLFETADQVHAALSDDFQQRLWRNRVIPSLLQTPGVDGAQGSYEDASLVTASAGGAMPTQWQHPSAFVDFWARERTNSVADFDLDGDLGGFFRPHAAGYRPAGFHPLVLAVLAKQFQARLDSGESAAFALEYAKWLVSQVFADDQSHDRATPSVAFAAGGLILGLAQRADIGVVIAANGTITAPLGNVEWKELAEQMLDCVVRSGERNAGGVPSWDGRQATVKRLLSDCPAWHRTPILTHLEQRAQGRLQEVLEPLTDQLPDHAAEVANFEFSPATDALERNVLPELRPSEPMSKALDTQVAGALGSPPPWKGEWKDYYQGLGKLTATASALEAQGAKVVEISTRMRELRNRFEDRYASPLARSVLPRIVATLPESVQTHPVAACYLARQLAQITLTERRSDAPADGVKTLADRPEWLDAINATTADTSLAGASENTRRAWWESVGRAWARLEPWDPLRGRLSEAKLELNDPDLKVTGILLDRLLAWLGSSDWKTPAEHTAARPALAALSHLGVAPDARRTRRRKLIAMFEDRLKQDNAQVPVALKQSIAAGRLELALTSLVADPDASLEQLFGDVNSSNLTALERLLGWIRLALESPIAWESRAGFNALLGLSRVAQAAGEVAVVENLHNLVRGPDETGERLKTIISATRQVLETGGGPSGVSGLALALIASDLRAAVRDEDAGLPDAVTSKPGWIDPATEKAQQIVDGLSHRMVQLGPGAFAPFRYGGGQAAKRLVLGLLDIHHSRLEMKRRLRVTPLPATEAEVLLKLQGVARVMLCGQELLLNGLPEPASPAPATVLAPAAAPTASIPPWWKLRYWSARGPAAFGDGLIAAESIPLTGVDQSVADSLDREELPPTLVTALSLTTEDARVRIETRGERWLALAESGERRVIQLRLDRHTATPNLAAEVLEPRFPLLDWAPSYAARTSQATLVLAAQLEADSPAPLPAEMAPFEFANGRFKDIDGRYAGSLNRLTFGAAHKDLKKKVKALEGAEADIKKELEDQRGRWDQAQVVDLLKQPLRLATADYQEKLQAAVADVRRAEAELEVAEHEQVSAELEHFASELMVEALDVERERLAAAKRIAEIETQIVTLDTEAKELKVQMAEDAADVRKLELDLAQNSIERARLKQEQAERARVGIKREIDLVRELLGSDTTDDFKKPVVLADGTELGEANGKIAALGLRVKHSVETQLAKDLEEAKAAEKDAKEKERERKKREKRRRFVNAVCKFVGAAVGAFFGGPAGATLGAQIGGAVAEITNGVIENKPADEIMVGLVDDAFAIAAAAGYDLETKLNEVGKDAAGELRNLFDDIDANLGSIIDDLPEVFDEGMLKDAFEVLGLEEVPEIAILIDKTYDDLKSELKVQDLKLGTALASVKKGDAISVQDSAQLLTHLKDKLFGNMDKTASGIDQITKLGRKLDQKVEDLSDPAKREAAARGIAERLGKLVITQVGQETAEFRRDVVSDWIKAKREAKQAWNDVADEGQALLVKLFPDPDVRVGVLADVQAALLPPDVIRAKMQDLMKGWQDELDQALEDVMAVGNEQGKPSSAMDAAAKRVQYLESVQTKFNDELVKFLKGEKGEERGKLLERLDKLQQNELDAATNVAINDIDVTNALTDAAIADAEIKRAELAVEEAEKQVEASELGVTASNWKVKMAELAQQGFEKQTGVTKTMSQAAAERVLAAKARVDEARAGLEVAEALEQAAASYATEAGRTRQALNAPPLRLPGAHSAAIAEKRAEHADQLETALQHYREILRYLHAIGFDKEKIPPLHQPGSLEATPSTWGAVLTKWSGDVNDKFLDSEDSIVSDWKPMSWELTPEQIAALTSVSGFRIVVSDQKGVENPKLFDVPADVAGDDGSLLDALKTGKLTGFLFGVKEDDTEHATLAAALGDGPLAPAWRHRLRKEGITLSSDAKISPLPNIPGHWRVIDRAETAPERLRLQSFVVTSIGSELKVFGRSSWIELFERQGIPLSRNLSVASSGIEGPWKIKDETVRPVRVVTYGEDDRPRRGYDLTEANGAELKAYDIRRLGQDGGLSIHMVHDGEFRAGRSAPANLVFMEETSKIVKTGRVAAVFVSGKTNNGEFKESDFNIEINHRGDRWIGRKRLELQGSPGDPQKLRSSRAFELNTADSGSLAKLEEIFNARSAAQGAEPDPFVFEGTPLSGTTVMRLRATGQTELYRATIHLLYKFYE